MFQKWVLFKAMLIQYLMSMKQTAATTYTGETFGEKKWSGLGHGETRARN
jgi:hypothetical protein